MTVWVSKEASRAQEYRHQKIMAADNDFRVEKLKLLNLTVFLCIWQNFLCVIEVAGAMWIIILGGGSLCFSTLLWSWTFIRWENFITLHLGYSDKPGARYTLDCQPRVVFF